jgi:glycosyltransferase involved in cell wall biosynthesis
MKKKRRIVITFASVPFIRGGAELHAESLKKELKNRGYETELIMIPFQWEPKIEIIKNIIMWRSINIEQIAGKSVDLVIATKFPSYVIKHPNKVTWLFHQHRAIYDLYGTPYSDFDCNNEYDMRIRSQIMQIDNKTLAESKRIFSNAKNTSNRLKQYNNLDAECLYHPPKHYGKYYCEEYGDYILSVGRLEGLKRVDLLIRAMQFTDKKVKCIIAGTGGLENHLRKLTKELKLESRIKFLGFVDDGELLKLYANCFAVFFAPYDEDYGYITLEAFLSKKPIITASDSGGVMEFAQHETNALVAKAANPEILGGFINKLYQNRSTLCRDYGNNGYLKVKDISWDYAISKLTSTL